MREGTGLGSGGWGQGGAACDALGEEVGEELNAGGVGMDAIVGEDSCVDGVECAVDAEFGVMVFEVCGVGVSEVDEGGFGCLGDFAGDVGEVFDGGIVAIGSVGQFASDGESGEDGSGFVGVRGFYELAECVLEG